MANTYTQIHIQFVFAVKYRTALIGNEWKERLHQYLTGIFSREQTQNDANKQHARPYTYFYWNEAASTHIIINANCKKQKAANGLNHKICVFIHLRGRKVMVLFRIQKAMLPM